jgi:hypothetical protein
MFPPLVPVTDFYRLRLSNPFLNSYDQTGVTVNFSTIEILLIHVLLSYAVCISQYAASTGKVK